MNFQKTIAYYLYYLPPFMVSLMLALVLTTLLIPTLLLKLVLGVTLGIVFCLFFYINEVVWTLFRDSLNNFALLVSTCTGLLVALFIIEFIENLLLLFHGTTFTLAVCIIGEIVGGMCGSFFSVACNVLEPVIIVGKLKSRPRPFCAKTKQTHSDCVISVLI